MTPIQTNDPYLENEQLKAALLENCATIATMIKEVINLRSSHARMRASLQKIALSLGNEIASAPQIAKEALAAQYGGDTTLRALKFIRATINQNHKWHQEHNDEFEGDYYTHELPELNETALIMLKQMMGGL